MKLITYIIAVFMLLSSSALAAGATQATTAKLDQGAPAFVSLNADVTVTEGVVRLGDIFQGVGRLEDRVVAYAPRPGSRAVFDARWLLRLATAYKLNWRPGSVAERLVIERASQVVTKNEIEDLLQQRHVDEGGDPSSHAIIANRVMRLNLPITDANGSIPTLSVEQMTVEPSNQNFTAVLSWGNGSDERMRVVGRIVRMAQVPVLSGRVMRDEVIDEANIEWQSLPEDRLPRATITDVDMIVGMAAKRSLSSGTPIAASDVRRPLLVNRGETVTMTLRTPSMELTTKGRALQNGSMGDTIRISNLQTNTVVDAIVTGSGQTRVESSVNMAMR